MKTTNHEQIRKWIEEQGGKPARVRGTSGGEDENQPGILRVDFPDRRGPEALEGITWEKFFEAFDRAGLACEIEQGRKPEECRFVKRSER